MDVSLADLGAEIFAAERGRTTIEPLHRRIPDLSPANAYAIQQSYARLRRDGGAILVGRKIGCTSAAIQELFGIDTPDYGQLFDDMLIADNGTVRADELIAPMVEPEIAFRLGTDVCGPGLTADDVLAATSAVMPAIEIIDSRVRDWKIEFVDTVADNGSSARFVLGPQLPYDPGMDLAGEGVWLTHDGHRLHHGTGADVLGHPANAVAWLGNALAEFGHQLQAGHWVLSGSMTTAVPAVPGRRYTAEFDTLGTVTCRVGEVR
jgi:2-keto-4-pentenoate hydratase